MSFFAHFTPSWKKPIVKNIVNLFFWTFIFFGVYLLLLAQEPSWEYPRFQGIIALVSAFFIALPLYVYRKTRLRKWYNEHFVHVSEALVALSFVFNGLGALYFFDVPWGYDSLIHFANSLFAVLLIFLLFGAFLTNDDASTRILLFFCAVVGAFFFGVLMEGWEWFADAVFFTRTWGERGQSPLFDTASDLFYNALGSAFGGLFLFLFARQWLARLRHVSPQIREFAAEVKERVQNQVQEKISLGKEKLHTMKMKGFDNVRTTKKRLRRLANRRSKKALNSS